MVIINNAVLNMEVQMPLQHTDFNFLEYITSSGIAQSYGSSILSFLRNSIQFFIMTLLLHIAINSV
jgi:hypothetical protein